MAVDKLVDSTQLDSDLTSVANAIRTKGGTSAQLSFPNGFVDAVGAIQIGGLSEVTLASTATKSEGVVNLILAGITIQSDHMYIMSIKNKNKSDWISDQFIAGAYSINGGKSGLRYRNGTASSIPISTSYDAKNEIGDTYVFSDVLMWGT